MCDKTALKIKTQQCMGNASEGVMRMLLTTALSSYEHNNIPKTV